MSERALESNKRLLPAEMISEEDVIGQIKAYQKERRIIYFDGEEELLLDFVFNLVVTNTDEDGKLNKQWKNKGTKQNEYYKDLMRRVPVNKRKTFVLTADAISDKLIQGSVNARRQDAISKAKSGLTVRSIGDIPDKLGGRGPWENDPTGNPKGLGYIQGLRED